MKTKDQQTALSQIETSTNAVDQELSRLSLYTVNTVFRFREEVHPAKKAQVASALARVRQAVDFLSQAKVGLTLAHTALFEQDMHRDLDPLLSR